MNIKIYFYIFISFCTACIAKICKKSVNFCLNAKKEHKEKRDFIYAKHGDSLYHLQDIKIYADEDGKFTYRGGKRYLQTCTVQAGAHVCEIQK